MEEEALEIFEKIEDNLTTEPGEREELTSELLKNLADKCSMCGRSFEGAIPSEKYVVENEGHYFHNKIVCPSCYLSFDNTVPNGAIAEIQIFINSKGRMDARRPK